MKKTTNTLKINATIVNKKRHTTGFVLSNREEVTRHKAAQLAKSGLLDGYRAIRTPTPSGGYKMYVKALEGATPIIDLPMIVR